MAKKEVKFLWRCSVPGYGGYNKGEQAIFDEKTGSRLIDTGYAELVRNVDAIDDPLGAAGAGAWNAQEEEFKKRVKTQQAANEATIKAFPLIITSAFCSIFFAIVGGVSILFYNYFAGAALLILAAIFVIIAFEISSRD